MGVCILLGVERFCSHARAQTLRLSQQQPLVFLFLPVLRSAVGFFLRSSRTLSGARCSLGRLAMFFLDGISTRLFVRGFCAEEGAGGSANVSSV